MPQKNRTQIFILIFLFSILMLCGIPVVLYLTYGSTAYTDSIYQTLPKFAPLNEQVLVELGTPDGVGASNISNSTDKNISTYLFGYRYDVSLRATYIIGNTTLDKAIAYYKNLLQTKGWEQDSQEESSQYHIYVFHRGTTCIYLDYFTSPGVDGYLRYTLGIWHDLWAQSFSAPKPPPFLMWHFQSWPCPP